MNQMSMVQKLGAFILFGRKGITSFESLADFFSRQKANSKTSSTLTNTSEYLSAVETISFVGRCVRTIAGDIAAMPWEITDENGDPAKGADDIINLFKKPCPGINNYNFIAMSVLHLLLDGNVFIVPDAFEKTKYSVKNGIYNTLNLVTPCNCTVRAGNTIISASTQTSYSYADRYDISLSSKIVSLEANKMHHIKYLNGNNCIRGMGIIQENAPTLDQDRISSIFNNAFYKFGAQSNMVVKPPVDMGPEDFELWQKLFAAKFTGAQNWGKPIYTLPGGEITPLNLSNKDMQYLEQRKFTQQYIASVFYLPDLIAGLNVSGKYDTAKEQIEIYQTLTLPRFYLLLESGYTALIQSIAPALFFKFRPKHTVNQEKMQIVVSSLFDRGIINGNEGRELIGLDKRDDQPHLEDFYIGMSYLPVSEAGYQPEETTDEDGKAYNPAGRRKQLMYLRTASKTKTLTEKKILPIVKEYYRAQKERVLTELDKHKDIGSITTKEISSGIGIGMFFDEKKERDEMRKNAAKFHTAASTVSINEINKVLKTSINPSFQNYRFKLVVDKLGTRYINRKLNTDREAIKKIINQNIEQGNGLADLKADIQDHYDTYLDEKGWAAVRVARTEAMYSFDQASKLAFEDLQVKMVDVIGCKGDDDYPESNCNRSHIPIGEMDTMEFHPNHTGCFVPSLDEWRA
jgi:HK97 family phage portal protein